ncbi:MAG TPA: DUF455 family protein [Verrucomicrobiales bacterium]|nr:DUF455 family protein [Verrucomicrobiales bacterium]
MELRAFAERVLLSDSLEEKLAPPAGMLADHEPGPALELPDTPGRPAGLRMAGRGDRVELPPERELHRDEPRAVLLHLFANHELLATELMALAILRFPDAPRAFRRALLQTLQEEQWHTRLYMKRMAACGLTFGDLPVNGFFWRHVSGMQSPLDYVSRLSLTFEQANLDYSKHFAGVFERLGDSETAALMQRIYEDEIGHVGCGLRWFRKWKHAGESDWDAWRKVLRFPMGPARARGNVPFNAEGRRRAGLHQSFIDSLELFAQSRGRTPQVYLFNPCAERCALTRDPNAVRADRTTAGLARDLDLVPLLLCHEDDVVLVQRRPEERHLRSLKEAGLHSADFEVLDTSGNLAPDSVLRSRKTGGLRPWGWSADSAAVLQPLARDAHLEIPWNETVRSLYAKSTAAGLLAGLNCEMPEAAALAGTVATTHEEVTSAIDQWQRRGYSSIVLKAPWGLAGRSLLHVGEPADAFAASPQAAWVARILAEQGAVVVEPWLERVADFSVHYDVKRDAPPKLRGMVRLHNDSAGRFIACTAGGRFSRLLAPEVARHLHEIKGQRFYEEVLPVHLARLIGDSGFYGWLGIDAFFHRDAAGAIRLRPVVEINPRCTMGRVTLEARRFVAPESPVSWRIFYHRRVREAGCAGLVEFAARLHSAHPVVKDGSRLSSGAVCLNDPASAENFLGVLFAGESALRCIDAALAPP